MTRYNVKVKNGIAFNLDDEFQLEQYNHICKIPNVSGYLKRLIAMDMRGTWSSSPTVSTPEEEIAALDTDMMLNLL